MARASATASEPLIAGEPWSQIWPGIASHLQRVIQRRIPGDADAAELVQETAFRLLRSAKDFRDSDHLAREATRIAMNLATDLRRRSRLIAWCALTDDVRATDDVERQVVSADQLASLERHAAARSVDLLALAGCSVQSQPLSEAAKSRRYRARQIVRQWREAAGAVLGLPKLRWLLGATAAATLVPGALLPFAGIAPQQEGASAPRDSETSVAASRAVQFGGLNAVVGVAAEETMSRSPAARGHSGPTYRSELEVRGPAGTGLDKGAREYPPEEQPSHIACIREAGPVTEICVDHPLRD